MKKITVIGAGTMGNGIAHVFATNGFPVVLFDINNYAIESGVKNIKKNIDRQVNKGLLSAEEASLSLDRISPSNNLKNAVNHIYTDLKYDKNLKPTILFSPAAASFDQFINFEVRGDYFKTLVMKKFKKRFNV